MRPVFVLLGSAALVVSMATAAPTPAVGRQARAPRPPRPASEPSRDDLAHYDARRAVHPARPRRPRGWQRSRAAALRRGGVFEIDPATGTVRILEKLDGYLTGPSGRPRADRRPGLRAPAPRRARADQRRPRDVPASTATTSTSPAPTTCRGPRRSAA